MTQHQKPSQVTAYRPIAPSISPPNTLPRPQVYDIKRKWNSSIDNDVQSGLVIDKKQRRGSASSQGSNSSPSLAADQRKRRKEQNRAAQRAFRERKERYVKELEDKIKEIKAAHALQVSQLEKENADLKLAMKGMQDELDKFRGNNSNHSDDNDNSNGVLPAISSLQSLSVDKAQLSPSGSDTRSPANSTPAATTPRIPSSAVACIRDKDGASFCERLKKEVCSNAYNQLLTEPLFDSQGYLNETLASHPVPIVTSSTKEPSKIDVFNELEQFLTANFSSKTTADNTTTNSINLISCSEAWQRISKHPKFEQFSTDELCNMLQTKAKCSKAGPVFEEDEVQQVMDLMVLKTESP